MRTHTIIGPDPGFAHLMAYLMADKLRYPPHGNQS